MDSTSPTPQGGQWFVPALFFGFLAFAYWGLRPESAEDRAAYAAMQRRRAARRR